MLGKNILHRLFCDFIAFTGCVCCLLMLSFSAQAEDAKESTGVGGLDPHQRGSLTAEVKLKSLTAVGSDSMADLMKAWVSAYQKQKRDIAIQVLPRGSATAPNALIDGTAELGPMARPMKTVELNQFIEKYGFEPTQIRTAVAGAAIKVSDLNPISQLTITQLDSIFSADRKRGAEKTPTTWGELGVSGDFGKEKIVPVIFTSVPQTQNYFKQQVLAQGRFLENIQTLSDVSALQRVLSSKRGAVAIVDFDLVSQGAGKSVAVRRDTDEIEGEASAAPAENNEAASSLSAQEKLAVRQESERGSTLDPKTTPNGILPTAENLANGTYPIARYLNIYIVRYPGEPAEISTKDFLLFVLSKEGQSIATKLGFQPLTAEVLREELTKLE